MRSLPARHMVNRRMGARMSRPHLNDAWPSDECARADVGCAFSDATCLVCTSVPPTLAPLTPRTRLERAGAANRLFGARGEGMVGVETTAWRPLTASHDAIPTSRGVLHELRTRQATSAPQAGSASHCMSLEAPKTTESTAPEDCSIVAHPTPTQTWTSIIPWLRIHGTDKVEPSVADAYFVFCPVRKRSTQS